MAFAETANLIVDLSLRGDLKRGLQDANRGLGDFQTRLRNTDRIAQGVGRGISNALKIGVGAAAVGIGVIAVNVKKGVDSLNELQNVTVATNTVLESTGGVSGQTASSIRDLSEEYENLNATMDDKVIQSGANMLLTFTNIREDAFEPALEAALNLNEAMGGGPEGLQGVVIKVGKALNDPIKGLTALSRAGVLFTDKQKEQIKTLQESGDLYGAQQIILKELGTEFGGRFANAGKTAESRMAKLGDAIEDLQQSLAGPLIPVIDRVREKLIDFLDSKRARDAAKTLGDAIAGLFTNKNIDRGVAFLEDALDTVTDMLKGGGEGGGALTTAASSIGTIASSVAGLPWESIGNAAKLLGTGSKALLDAFLGLPGWVQTAVLTGWGLNKLTGGALTSIVGQLASGLVKGILGINAGVVNLKAGTVIGGGGPGGAPVPGGGRSGPTALLGAAGLAGAALAIGTAVGTEVHAALLPIEHRFNELVPGTKGAPPSLSLTEASIQALSAELGVPTKELKSEMIPLLEGGNLTWEEILDTVAKSERTQGQRLEEGNRYAATLNRNTVTQAEKAQAQRREGNQYVRTLNSVVATRQNQGTQTQRLEEGNRYANTLNSNVNTNTQTTASRLDTVRARMESANVHLSAIERKKTSVNVTVRSTTSIAISASQMQNRVYQLNLTSNSEQWYNETLG